MNLIPFVLADIIINKSKIKKSHYIGGAIIGSSLFFHTSLSLRTHTTK